MNEKLFKLLCESGFILEAILKIPEPEKTNKLTKLLAKAVADGNLDYSEKMAKYLGRKLETEELMKIREKLLDESMYIDSFLKVSDILLGQVLGQVHHTDGELEKFLTKTVLLGLLDNSLKIAKKISRDLTEEELATILEKHMEKEGNDIYGQIYNSQKTAESILKLI